MPTDPESTNSGPHVKPWGVVCLSSVDIPGAGSQVEGAGAGILWGPP